MNWLKSVLRECFITLDIILGADYNEYGHLPPPPCDPPTKPPPKPKEGS